MERIVHKARSFEDAERWDRAQHQRLSPEERMEIGKILRERAYGRSAPDVREAERS